MSSRPFPDELVTQKQYALLEQANAHKAKLDRIVSNLSGVVFETDASGNWTFLNQAWAELTGFSVPAALGSSFLDYVYPEDRDRNASLFQPLMERKKASCRHQVRYILNPEGFVWVEVHARLLFDENDNIIGTAGTLTNVHKQRLLLEELERKDKILEATYQASCKLVDDPLSIEEENSLLASISEAAGLVTALITDIDTSDKGSLLKQCREIIRDTEPALFSGLTHQQSVARFPILSCIIDPKAKADQACISDWQEPGTDRACFILMLPVTEGSRLRKVLLLIAPQPWNQHDTNALKVLCQKYSLVLERHAAKLSLAESEGRLSFALEGGNEGVWDWNIQTGEVYFSPRWAEMLGYQVKELTPNISSWEKLVHPDDMDAINSTLAEHLRGDTEFYEASFRSRHKSGHWVWILDRGKVVERDTDGTPKRAVGTHLDITAKKEIEEKLAQRTAELAAANKEIDEVLMISPVGFLVFDNNDRSAFFTPCFAQLLNADASLLGLTETQARETLLQSHTLLSERLQDHAVELVLENKANRKIIKINMSNSQREKSVDAPRLISAIDITREYNLDKMKSYFMSAASHELRTPLASICGFSELLMECRDTFSADEQAQMIKSIYNQSNALASIISQLLDVSRIESGREIDVTPVQINLTEHMPELIGQFTPDENTHNINCEPEPDCIALADEDFLLRIFSNLLSNACRYSPKGSTITVKLGPNVQHGRQGVRIEVIDQGIGMDKQEVDSAFDKFYRADKSGKVKGMGLGLHIVRELVGALHGTIDIQSQKGAGTTVNVWFPAHNRSDT